MKEPTKLTFEAQKTIYIIISVFGLKWYFKNTTPPTIMTVQASAFAHSILVDISRCSQRTGIRAHLVSVGVRVKYGVEFQMMDKMSTFKLLRLLQKCFKTTDLCYNVSFTMDNIVHATRVRNDD